FAAGFERTLEYLKSSGRQALLIEQVPLIEHNVPQTLARLEWLERELDIRPSRQQHDAEVLPVQAFFKDIMERYSFIRVNPAQLMCDDQFCQVEQQSQLLYRDSNHLSKLGSEFMAPLLSTVLAGP